MPLSQCPACGKEIPDAASACPHCGHTAATRGGRRGIPTLVKLILFLLLGATFVLFAVNKPTEDQLRQAIREKGRELQARGVTTPALLIDAPDHAERFTYRAHLLSSEITYTSADGKVITVATGQLGSIHVSEKW